MERKRTSLLRTPTSSASVAELLADMVTSGGSTDKRASLHDMGLLDSILVGS